MSGSVRIELEARPGSAQESVSWDRWREVWVVRVREEAIAGRANDAILSALAGWLRVGRESVGWVRAGRGSRKVAEVRGVTATDVQARLQASSREL